MGKCFTLFKIFFTVHVCLFKPWYSLRIFWWFKNVFTNALTLLPLRDGASLAMWAESNDSFLMNWIKPKRWYTTSETRSSLLLMSWFLSLGLFPLAETNGHFMSSPLRGPGGEEQPARNRGPRSKLGNGSSCPVEPSDNCSPGQHLDYNLIRDPEQEPPAKLWFPDPQKVCKIIFIVSS